MAILNLYTLHDVKALQYGPPFTALNDALARRMLLELVMDNNTSIGRHPGDFKLFKLGGYDDQKGEFHLLPVHEHIIDAVALVPPPSPTLPFDKLAWKDIPGTGLQRTNGEAK